MVRTDRGGGEKSASKEEGSRSIVKRESNALGALRVRTIENFVNKIYNNLILNLIADNFEDMFRCSLSDVVCHNER